MKFNVPGRLVDFYKGSQSWVDYSAGTLPAVAHDLDQDEYELFEAVAAGKKISAKGGYYVRAELSEPAVEALRYWAETLETASQDNAAYESDARLELRAARRVLAAL